jgi:hypothetical protein
MQWFFNCSVSEVDYQGRELRPFEGLKFVTKASVDPYLSTQSRFEGSSNAEKVLTRSGPIS